MIPHPSERSVAPGPTVVDCIRQIVETRPSDVAIVTDNASLSYRELDERSDAVAAVVHAQIGPGLEPVVVLSGHDEAAPVAILGVLKSGRPVTVLDPFAPTERQVKISRLAQSSLFLASAAMKDAVPDVGSVTVIDECPTGPRAPKLVLSPDSPCVILFTSGSTGEPKGVMRNHRFQVTMASPPPDYPVSSTDRAAVVLPLAFSFAFNDLLGTLTNGATVHLFDPRRSGIGGLVTLLREQRITLISLTPGLLRSLAHASDETVFHSLRRITSAGEGAYGSDVNAIRHHVPASCIFLNRVGSAESGRYASFPVRFDEPAPDGPVPIGFPYPNVDVELVDERGKPVDQGTVGEVTVTSDCLPDGYWRQPELTAERYTELGDGRRSYRTGDLAKRDAAGVLHHLGRADRLVKVRGYRVAPAEVEAALMAMGDIEEAAVIGDHSQEQNRTRLLGYVVAARGRAVSVPAIRTSLRKQLPAYMVPERFVFLDALPRNVNGKVNVSQLPRSLDDDAQRQPRRMQPYTSWHWAVRNVFASVLELDTVGIHDDFFELGGDSLAALEVVSALEADYGLSVTSSALVENPTVDGLAAGMVASIKTGNQGLLTLRSGGDGTPLFCIPGAGGRVLGFMSIARLLCADRPIYGLQSRGVDRRGVPDWTIERVARRHLRAVRSVQPHGPYVFAGHSAGGWIALEMGHRLRAQGEEVTLIWLDTSTAKRADPGPTFELKTKNPIELCRRLKEAVTTRAAFPGQWIKTVRMTWLVPDERTYWDRRSQFMGLSRHMLRRYDLKPWPGKAIIYGATDGGQSDPDECASFFTGEWAFSWVSGDHSSILQGPQAGMIAEDLARELATDTGPAMSADSLPDEAHRANRVV